MRFEHLNFWTFRSPKTFLDCAE